MTWLICTMDDGIISEHPTKRDAVERVRHSTWGPLVPRRIHKSAYEYECRCDSDHCPTFYVMTEAVAELHGWEREA